MSIKIKGHPIIGVTFNLYWTMNINSLKEMPLGRIVLSLLASVF